MDENQWKGGERGREGRWKKKGKGTSEGQVEMKEKEIMKEKKKWIAGTNQMEGTGERTGIPAINKTLIVLRVFESIQQKSTLLVISSLTLFRFTSSDSLSSFCFCNCSSTSDFDDARFARSADT